MISLRSRTPSPRPLPFLIRDAFRLAFPLLCVCAALGLGTLTAAAGSFLPADPKHETPYALIFGTVWGPDDHPVYAVKIKIRREGEKKNRWEAMSDHNGEFAERVPAGKQDYVISADTKGLKSKSGKQLQGDEVKVHVDGDERVDTGLHLK